MQISRNTQPTINPTLQSEVKSSYEKLLKRNDLGFFKLPHMQELWDKSEKVTQSFRSKFSHFIWVGIGGSSLGPKALSSSLGVGNFDFIENPDLKTIQRIENKLKSFKDVGFIFVSKSGTTIETLGILEHFHKVLDLQGLQISEHSLVITELRASSLFDWAEKNTVPVLEIPLNVGGRFSVISSVGQAFLGLAGKSIKSFQQGALSCFDRDFQEKTLFPMIQFFAEGLSEKDILTYFWYYSDSGYLLGKWIEQLWAESLGKKESPLYTASVPIATLGANDQHSVLQQMMETPLKKSVVVHRFGDSEREEEAKFESSQFNETKSLVGKSLGSLLKTEAIAMTEGQREIKNHVLELFVPELNEFEVAQYFMTYKLIVGTLGEFMKINAFDQPGVELCKVITKKMLSQ